MTRLLEYFQRIGYKGSLEPTLENLKAIHAAQAHSIPFETFDISLNVPIVLKFENIFDKLVRKRRGGYCYEVNALLYFALQSLGFKSSLCSARLMDDGQNILPESVHMVVIVELEERWLADVGWGRGFVHPFCMDIPTEQHDHRIGAEGEGYILYHRDKKLHYFTLEPRTLEFFEARNLYHQTSSSSPFAEEVICSLPFEMIRGSVYRNKPIATDEEYRLLLDQVFGLHLDVNRPVRIEHEGHLLHNPRNSTDWAAYHQIRIKQIHERYCPELTYNPHDPEEKDLNNFPLVFRKEGSDRIIGTIRIDLLPENEASLRWIAIDPEFVRKGFGTKMVSLAERFIHERGRKLIRIPATAESLPFSASLGYSEEPWALMPQEECMIAVCKTAGAN